MQEIAIISQYFYPSLASTAQLMTDLGQGFAKQGYTVKVFTSSNAASFPATNYLNKVRVSRSTAIFQQGHSILSKISNSLFFLVGAFGYILFRVSRNTPLLIASNPPYAGILGIAFKLLKGGEFYFLLQDIFPESAVLSEIIKPESKGAKMFGNLIYFTCLHSKATIVLSTSMKAFLEQKYTYLKEKKNIHIIENWAIEDIPFCDKEKNEFAIENGLNQIFTVLYSGNIGRLHDIETIAQAAQILQDSPIQFVFIGDGPKQKILEHYIEEYRLKNILLLPPQPRETIGRTLTACDVSLVSLIEGAEQIIAPCKLYGMLASGRAIVSISSPNSYIDRLISTYECGINSPPKQPQQLANLLQELIAAPLRVKAMGEKSRKLYEEKYTFGRALHEYEQLLLKVEKEMV